MQVRTLASSALFLAMGGIVMVAQGCGDPPGVEEGGPGREVILLPEPRATGPVPLEEAVERRRSARDFRSDPLDLPQVTQLLWAAQGVTGRQR